MNDRETPKCDRCGKHAKYKHEYGGCFCEECLIRRLELEPIICDCCGKEIESKPLRVEEGFDNFKYFCSTDCAIKFYDFERISNE